MAGDPTPFLQAAKRYGSDPAFDKWARSKYGVSGAALLAKVSKGESGYNMAAKSSAGAQGGTQFMPATRAAFIKRYGVDAWKDPDSAVHATKLYLQHDKRGVAGYNPGMPSYTDYILGQKVGDLGAVKGGGRASAAQVRTTTTPGVDNSAVRAQAVQDFLGSKSANPVSFAMAIRNAQDVPGKTVAKTASAGDTSSSGTTSKLVSRANAINAKKLPYLYGGGHQGGRVNAYTNSQPLDCSAAVSTVLGINPKVSGQFESFGKPGDGGSKGVTIAANGHHVLMKIDGRWFGTSASNPQGGAGWIDEKQISPQYLKGFTLRHA